MIYLVLILVVTLDMAFCFFIVRPEYDMIKLAIVSLVELLFIGLVYLIADQLLADYLGNSSFPMFIIMCIYALVHAIVTKAYSKNGYSKKGD